MSTVFYKMVVGDNGETYCYSATDQFAAEIDEEFEKALSPERCTEMNPRRLDSRPRPVCRVLSWDTDLDATGKMPDSIKEASVILHDLATGRCTKWGLSDVIIARDGYVNIQLIRTNPYHCGTEGGSLYCELELEHENDEKFCILFETMGSGFARTQYLIKRFRHGDDPRPSKRETVVEVTERSGTGLLRRVFHCPDKGEAYCEIMECRR